MIEVKTITSEQLHRQNCFSEALVIPVTPGNKICLHGFNNEVQKELHYLFELETKNKSNLKHGQTIIINEMDDFFGFKNGIFIIDDLCYSICGIVFRSLKKAEESAFYSVDIPTIWNRDLDFSEIDTLTLIAGQIALGVRHFMYEIKPKYLTEINLIVSNDFFEKKLNSMFVNH